MRAIRPLNVGDPATEFEAEAPGGRKLHLADFRGKFVLLNVLMTRSSGISLPRLKETFQAFGHDDRLAMFSVSYLPVQSLEEFARTNGISWTLASYGKPSVEFEDYFQSVTDFSDSQLFLINPEGKILAKDLHGAAITEAVAKVLAPEVMRFNRAYLSFCVSKAAEDSRTPGRYRVIWKSPALREASWSAQVLLRFGAAIDQKLRCAQLNRDGAGVLPKIANRATIGKWIPALDQSK